MEVIKRSIKLNGTRYNLDHLISVKEMLGSEFGPQFEGKTRTGEPLEMNSLYSYYIFTGGKAEMTLTQEQTKGEKTMRQSHKELIGQLKEELADLRDTADGFEHIAKDLAAEYDELYEEYIDATTKDWKATAKYWEVESKGLEKSIKEIAANRDYWRETYYKVDRLRTETSTEALNKANKLNKTYAEREDALENEVWRLERKNDYLTSLAADKAKELEEAHETINNLNDEIYEHLNQSREDAYEQWLEYVEEMNEMREEIYNLKQAMVLA